MPSQTAGYKAGNLKSVDEYKNLDANDESLNRWKASLGLANADGAPASGPKVSGNRVDYPQSGKLITPCDTVSLGYSFQSLPYEPNAPCWKDHFY